MRPTLPRTLPQPYIVLPGIEGTATGTVGGWGNGGWSANNSALYMPVRLPAPARISAMSFYCQAASGTYDLGIYDATCTTRLMSQGSQAATSTSVVTWTLPSVYVVQAGELFYIGMSASTTSLSTSHGGGTLLRHRAGGMMEELTHPLPATATPVQIAHAFYPFIALSFV